MKWHERKAKKDRRREERKDRKRRSPRPSRTTIKSPTTPELLAGLDTYMRERRQMEGAAIRFAVQEIALGRRGGKTLLVADSAGGTLILRGTE